MQSRRIPHMTVPRHWCPTSETYAGTDALLTHYQHGWLNANTVVIQRQVALPTTRFVTLYCFTLQKADAIRELQIIQNPAVERLIQQLGLEIVMEEEEVVTVS